MSRTAGSADGTHARADPGAGASTTTGATRNPAATRARLEQAALELFDQHGFDEVTTAQIAAVAGVSQRTFFRHFPTKVDALLGDTAQRTYDFVLCLHRQPLNLALEDALVAAIASSDTTSTYETDLLRAKVLRGTPSLAATVRTYEATLESYFADWIAQRSRRQPDDFEVQTIAAVLVAARRVVMQNWYQTGGTTPVDALARRAMRTVALRFPSGLS